MRLYKTGDLCRWLEDGNIEFLGRIDFQVKIRGFRIELGEIEAQLLKHPEIKETVVLARDSDSGEIVLCAYLVAKTDQPLETQVLREFLGKNLPDYMIPAHFVFLGQMPLNANSKVDRKALPEPESGLADAYRAPENSLEEALVGIWSEVLKLEKNRISTDRSFFNLGGHSLKATIMMGQIQKKLAIKVPLEEIFKRPTIREIAQAITSLEKSSQVDLEKGEEKEYYELSYNQKRLFVIHRLNPQSSAFNMPGVIAMNEDADERVIGQAIAALAARHESLRTRFIIRDNRPVQVVEKSVKLPFRVEDLSSLGETEKAERRNKVYEEVLGTPFDIGEAPLFRALLVKMKAGEYELLFNMHHIISDGWSLEVLKRDFIRLLEMYRQGREAELPELELQYRDFADWQNRLIIDERRKQEAHAYWRARLASAGWDLALPRDFVIEPDDNRGAGYRCRVSRELLDQLQAVSLTYRTSLFVVMFAVYIVMLRRYSEQDDVPCSIISAGREDASLYPVIGFFVNSVLFKIGMNKEEVFGDFLKRVHEEVMGSLRSQGYPVELVLEEMKMRHPDIRVSFNMVNLGDLEKGTESELDESHHEAEVQDVKFDIELYAREYSQGLDLDWRYRKGAYKPETVEFMAGEYLKILAFFAADPGKAMRFQLGQSGKGRTFSRVS